MNTERIKRVLRNMEDHGLEQILITSTSSIFYLTGKWIESGERMLVLYLNNKGKNKLFINELFSIDDNEIDTVIYNDVNDPIFSLSNEIIRNKVLGIDKTWPSGFLIRLMKYCPDVSFSDGSSIVDEVRMIKDEEEKRLMRISSKINDLVMEEAIKKIGRESSESNLCKQLQDLYLDKGAEGFSFFPLIAYGKGAAEPHHSSDNSLPEIGNSIILDIGGKKDFYCSDMTRTVFYGECSDENRKIYNIVLEANLKAIEIIKPGVTFSEIDLAARNHIEKSGYGAYFTHRTGHNIGIDVHEFADVSSNNKMPVEAGMIFSIEPGIYLPGRCGVRIEDLVLVTEDGCEILNHYPKELQII